MNPIWNELPDLQEIARRLTLVHRRWLLLSATRATFLASAVLLGLFWLLVFADYLWGLSVAARASLWVGLGGVALAGIALFVRNWLGAVPLRKRALELERYSPELREQLITAVEMASGDELRRLGYSPLLYSHTVRVARQSLENLDLRRFWQRVRVARGIVWLAIGAGATMLLVLLFPGASSRTLYALTNPSMEISRPAPFTWTVTDPDKRILQYEDVAVAASADGSKPPALAKLMWQYLDGSEWYSEELAPEAQTAGAHFTHTFSALPQSVRYRFEAEGRKSKEHTVTVARRPEITQLAGICVPPRYTGIDEFALASGQNKWIVPDHSTIRLTVQSDRALASGYIAFGDDTQTPLSVTGTAGEARLTVSGPQTLRVYVADTDGLLNHDPVPIEIETIPDLPPQIAFLEPGKDGDIPEAMVVPLAIALLDDYGFSKLVIIHRIEGQEGESAEATDALPLPSGFGKEGVFEFNWSLLAARLFPGDRVLYRARVYDNDPAAKWAETETFALRLPTLDEIIAETERNQQERTDKVSEAVLQQRQMAEELREMARQLVGKEKVEWENKQQIEQAMATEAQMAQDLQKWADDMEKEAEKLAQNRMASLEMIQKMNEIARLMEDVMTPQMKEALEKLREAMEAMSPEEMRQALEQFQMTQEEVMAQLDRALAQLRQMQLEQMMENMLRMAERLIENQEHQNAAADKAENQRTLDSLAREEEGLREDLTELQNKAAELAKKNKEYGGPKPVEEFAKSAGQCQAGADMEAMTQEAQRGDKSKAGESGKSASKKMRAMLGEMQQIMEGMKSEMSAEQLEKLRELANRSNRLSKEQEDMGDSTVSVSNQSLALREMAAKQMALGTGIERLLEEFDAQARENLFMNPEVRKSLRESQLRAADAVNSLLERNGPSSQGFQYETMFSLNEATRGLMESLDNQSQCQGGSPGQGKLNGGMQNLSQQQMQLNQESQGMRNPFGLGPGEQEAVKRLSAQQQSIRQQMEGLAEQFAQSRDRLGRLDEIAKSMEEVVAGLNQGEISDATLERQRNIYNRMLDFQKSLQRQDYENRRQSRSGTEVAHSSPDALDDNALGRRLEEVRWERFKNEWYPPRFRALVKDYFETVSRRNEGAE
jgi:hypothetical protein